MSVIKAYIVTLSIGIVLLDEDTSIEDVKNLLEERVTAIDKANHQIVLNLLSIEDNEDISTIQEFEGR